MITPELKLACLKLAAERNQKMNANVAHIVEEAKLYYNFVSRGFTKTKPDAKNKPSR